jgi:hypothetical protein
MIKKKSRVPVVPRRNSGVDGQQCGSCDGLRALERKFDRGLGLHGGDEGDPGTDGENDGGAADVAQGDGGREGGLRGDDGLDGNSEGNISEQL